MLFSPRTAKYADALIREGDSFDPAAWFWRMREEEARSKKVPAVVTSGAPVASGIGSLTNTSNGKNVPIKSVAIYPSGHGASSETPADPLRRRLVRVSNAFDKIQESRARDAVYGYLGAVFEIVEHYRIRRRTKDLLRRAFKYAGLPFDENADAFSAIIRCTCEQSIDNKTISKWARALRYAYECKRARTPLEAFIKKMGGINACADWYARYYGRRSR